jgi:hypothetical protein
MLVLNVEVIERAKIIAGIPATGWVIKAARAISQIKISSLGFSNFIDHSITAIKKI